MSKTAGKALFRRTIAPITRPEPLSTDARYQLRATLGVSDAEAEPLIRELAWLIGDYHAYRHFERATPRPGTVRRNIAEMREQAFALVQNMYALDEATAGLFPQSAAACKEDSPELKRDVRRSLSRLITVLNAAECSANELPDKPSEHPRSARRTLALEAAGVLSPYCAPTTTPGSAFEDCLRIILTEADGSEPRGLDRLTRYVVNTLAD
jgi:ribosomal protein L29